MACRVVVGAQWGDEGKGKVVDILARDSDIVARYQGGANAGHTVVIGNKKFVLHLIPSGIMHPKKICIIGNGVVVDLEYFFQELKNLEQEGIKTKGRLWISNLAHLVMPYHKEEEKFIEQKREALSQGQRIGTTGRGVGPAYTDKIKRSGIRVIDLWDEKVLTEKIKFNLETKALNSGIACSLENILCQLADYKNKIQEFVADTSELLHKALQKKKKILIEGAQGTLLDVDWGTYPFVTSSNTTAGGACTGLGIPPTAIDEVIGVSKAYTTRVGNGPFPTELSGELSEYLRDRGNEFGSTTNRPRRCGWLDLVALHYAKRINGFEKLAITKLDVLDNLKEIKICIGYELDGKKVKYFPAEISALEKAKPIYKTFPGWREKSSGLTSWKKLPENAKGYLKFISEELESKIILVSTGCKREETIVL